MLSRSLEVAVIGLWSAAAIAGTSSIEAANNQIGGQVLLRRINYAETSAGSTLATESGRVPGYGVFASLMYGKDHSYLAVDYEGFNGNTDYAGQTVGKSGAKITDISIRDGLGFVVNPAVMLTPYITVGYHKWDRNVLNGVAGGPAGTFQHVYYGVGLLAQYAPVQRLVLSGRVMAGRTDEAKLDVPTARFSESFGSAGTYQLGIGADYALTTRLHADARVVYASWRYGAGVLPNGQSGRDSQTSDMTLKAGLAYAF